jgi:hypothetical protein
MEYYQYAYLEHMRGQLDNDAIENNKSNPSPKVSNTFQNDKHRLNNIFLHSYQKLDFLKEKIIVNSRFDKDSYRL